MSAVTWAAAAPNSGGRLSMQRHIMVVDDEVGMLKIITLMLERVGYTVLGASNGHTALELLETETPDLIIADVMMPNMDGFELCRRIRAHPHIGHVPVIILSARTDAAAVQRAFDVGANAYMPKPTLHRDLISKVSFLLDMENNNVV